MIKKLRVTVDGVSYEVTVELPDESAPLAAMHAAAPVSAAPSASAPPPRAPQPPASPAPPAPAPAPPPTAPAGPSGPGDVPSPLTGRVTAVVATVGQAIAEGDHLITLEAMKMNTFVLAPRAGKVAEINTSVGAAVEEGQMLARIA